MRKFTSDWFFCRVRAVVLDARVQISFSFDLGLQPAHHASHRGKRESVKCIAKCRWKSTSSRNAEWTLCAIKMKACTRGEKGGHLWPRLAQKAGKPKRRINNQISTHRYSYVWLASLTACNWLVYCQPCRRLRWCWNLGEFYWAQILFFLRRRKCEAWVGIIRCKSTSSGNVPNEPSARKKWRNVYTGICYTGSKRQHLPVTRGLSRRPLGVYRTSY